MRNPEIRLPKLQHLTSVIFLKLLYHFAHFQPQEPVFTHPQFLHYTMPLFSTQSLSFLNLFSLCIKVGQHTLTSCLSSVMGALKICWAMILTNTETWPTLWLGAQWPVWTERYFSYKHTHTHQVHYMQICTVRTLPRVSSPYMHGCFCLFTSDNSCPAYAALLSMCYDSSFGGNGVPFSLFCPSHQCNYRSQGSFVL